MSQLNILLFLSIAETESVKSGSVDNKNSNVNAVVLDIDPSILPKTLKAKTNTNPQRQNPTAIVNKTRPPKGDVNLERSLEIVRSAVEKSSNTAAMQQQQPQAVPQPMVIPVRPSVQARTAGGTMPNAVLVTTSDGKTLLAHPTGQILQNIRPGQTLSPVSPSPIRLRLPNKPGQQLQPAPAITTGQQQPQVRQVCVVQQTAPATTSRPTTVFRMPTSSASGATVVLDTNQLNNLIVSNFSKKTKRLKLYFS